MSKKHQQTENQQEKKQPTTIPTSQVELTDEELEQAVGGGIIIHDSPAADYPPGPTIIAVL